MTVKDTIHQDTSFRSRIFKQAIQKFLEKMVNTFTWAIEQLNLWWKIWKTKNDFYPRGNLNRISLAGCEGAASLQCSTA